jgi:hypothetical protein
MACSHKNPRAGVFSGKDLVPPIEYSLSIDDVLTGVRSEIFVRTQRHNLPNTICRKYWIIPVNANPK